MPRVGRRRGFEIALEDVVAEVARRAEQALLAVADGDRAVGDLPIGLRRRLPAVERVAVEQRDPAVGELCLGQQLARVTAKERPGIRRRDGRLRGRSRCRRRCRWIGNRRGRGDGRCRGRRNGCCRLGSRCRRRSAGAAPLLLHLGNRPAARTPTSATQNDLAERGGWDSHDESYPTRRRCESYGERREWVRWKTHDYRARQRAVFPLAPCSSTSSTNQNSASPFVPGVGRKNKFQTSCPAAGAERRRTG